MKRMLAAISFLTRLPVPRRLIFGAEDTGRATVYFPLVGALIGLMQTGALLFFQSAARENTLRAVIAAALLVLVNVFVTGALHLDGLADMADGFGGGRDKDRILEIMRDSLIGSFGAVALLLLLLLKVVAIAALIESDAAWRIMLIAPALGRWATVPLGKFLPYARKSGGLGKSVTDYVGWQEVGGASVLMAIILFGLLDWRLAAVLWLFTVLITAFIGSWCRKKIGGITGDTMGANTEISETAVLLAAVFFR